VKRSRTDPYVPFDDDRAWQELKDDAEAYARWRTASDATPRGPVCAACAEVAFVGLTSRAHDCRPPARAVWPLTESEG
jgi:hypothetical protein